MSIYHEIEAKDLFNLMAEQPLLLVDVRNDDEVARGIIPVCLLYTSRCV